jgi:nucleoside-diphosphate-sugar epimerase
MATTKKPVLITGGAGLIGRILIARLHESYALTSFDLQRAKLAIIPVTSARSSTD